MNAYKMLYSRFENLKIHTQLIKMKVNLARPETKELRDNDSQVAESAVEYRPRY